MSELSAATPPVTEDPRPQPGQDEVDANAETGPIGVTARSLPAEQIGKYEVAALLGRGGMGAVYQAFDPVLEREVAVKVMLPQIAEDPEQKQRFEREARAIARIVHPNVVTVFDLGYHTDGAPYIVMELLLGRELLQLMHREPPLTLSRKISIVAQVLAGLGQAHKLGIVHRDIKPANVSITEDGTAKIMDFGIAHLASASATAEGSIMGTAAYMSPEQARGERVDGRSDLFSVGSLLCEMVTGRRPFEAETIMATLYAIDHNEPSIELPDGPEYERLRPVLEKALAKDRDARYQTSAEFAAALTACLDDSRVLPAREPGSSPVEDVPDTSPAEAPAAREPTPTVGDDAPSSRPAARPAAQAPAGPAANPSKLFRLLREVYVGGKSGHLHFSAGRSYRSLRILNGRILFGTSDADGEHLGDVLVRHGMITEDARKRRRPDRAAGAPPDRRGPGDRGGAGPGTPGGGHRPPRARDPLHHARGAGRVALLRGHGGHPAGHRHRLPALHGGGHPRGDPVRPGPGAGAEGPRRHESSSRPLRQPDAPLPEDHPHPHRRIRHVAGGRDAERARGPQPEPDVHRGHRAEPLRASLHGGHRLRGPGAPAPDESPCPETGRTRRGPAPDAAWPRTGPDPVTSGSTRPAESLPRPATMPRPPAATPTPTATPPPGDPTEGLGPDPEELRQLILEAHGRLKQDHFDVLGLSRSATEDDVRQAYALFARALHPDARRPSELADLEEKGREVFLRATAAYETLKDPEARRKYEIAFEPSKLVRPRTPTLTPKRTRTPPPTPAADAGPAVHSDPPPPPPPRAEPASSRFDPESTLRQAEAQFAKKEYWDVIQKVEPLLPQTRGPLRTRGVLLLARAYMRNPHWQKRAEEALLGLVQDDPTCTPAYLFLGQIYDGQKLPSRARSMYRKVVELEPENQAALWALGKLERSADEAPESKEEGGRLRSWFKGR